MLLAIESSCDESGVALLSLDQQSGGLLTDLLSSQVTLHQPYGGVVPELAAREHIVAISSLLEIARKEQNLDFSKLEAIAVTRGPGLNGCLLVGLSLAKALSYSTGVPLILVNHLEGHLYAFELEEGAHNVRYPILSLLVSGGHTMLILIRGFRDYQLIARTRDDAAGEAFDKSATLLGLPYPGGPSLAKTAQGGDRFAYELPVAVASDPGSFSFSGLKTAVLRLTKTLGASLEDDEVKRNVAASVEYTIVESLVRKTRQAIEAYQPLTLMLTGGVAANRYLREAMGELSGEFSLEFVVPPSKWCTDNAAMIAAVGRRLFYRDQQAFIDWNRTREAADFPQAPRASKKQFLGPGVELSCQALPRWPVESLC